MSRTGNEFDDPGVNYPDRGDAPDPRDAPRPDPVDETATRPVAPGPGDVGAVEEGIDHHGQDGGSDNLTAGETQRDLAGTAEQNVPAMSQNNASDAAKIDGIVAQTRQDVGDQDHTTVVQVLRQRFDQAGIEVAGDELDDLADRVLRQG